MNGVNRKRCRCITYVRDTYYTYLEGEADGQTQVFR